VVVLAINLVDHGGLLNMSDTEYDITDEMMVDFLIEHQIEDADELEEFSQMIHLLMMEPNIPVELIN
jgi:hypothetical protein